MRLYHLSTCIPISHSSSGDVKDAHYHTVEVEAYVRLSDDEFHSFSTIEKDVTACIRRYDDCYLNELDALKGDSCIENFGELLFQELTELLDTKDMTLDRLAIGETPLRVYAIQREA